MDSYHKKYTPWEYEPSPQAVRAMRTCYGCDLLRAWAEFRRGPYEFEFCLTCRSRKPELNVPMRTRRAKG